MNPFESVAFNLIAFAILASLLVKQLGEGEPGWGYTAFFCALLLANGVARWAERRRPKP